MPVLITVGRSCKRSKDFNSEGYSLSLQAELPSNVVDDPNALAEKSGELFQLVTDLLEDRVNADSVEPVPTRQSRAAVADLTKRVARSTTPSYQPQQPSGKRDGGNGNGVRGITTAQTNAIHNMARKVGEDPEGLAASQFNRELRELTIRQASALIDGLKEKIETGTAEAATR